MTRYVALLRGINVGGKGIVKMADLRAALEKIGLLNVSTYIQSGNVLFDSSLGAEALEKKISHVLLSSFKVSSSTMVRSAVQMKQTLAKVPADWKKRKDLRCYLAFLKASLVVADAAKEIKPREGVDSVAVGPGVLYLSTEVKWITKTGFTKMAQSKIYKDLTMRNYNTAQKIMELM